MPSLNEFKIIGNLTKDPVAKHQPGQNGLPMCELNIAVNGVRWDDEKEQYVPATEYFNNIAVWGQNAEYAAKFLTTGALVLLEGSLRVDRWEKPNPDDPQNPQKRSAMRFSVQKLQGLSLKPRDDK